MTTTTSLDQAIASFTRSLYQRWQSGEAVPGIPSGWAEFDRLTGGFPAPGITAVICDPDVPLGGVLVTLATNIAVRQHQNVTVVAPAMTSDLLVARLLAAESGVALSILETGRLTQSEWERVDRASNRLLGAPLRIFADHPMSPTLVGMAIAAAARPAAEPPVVLVRSQASRGTERRDLGVMCRDLAGEGLTVIVLASASAIRMLGAFEFGVGLLVTMDRARDGTVDVTAYDATKERRGRCTLALDGLGTRLAPVAEEVDE